MLSKNTPRAKVEPSLDFLLAEAIFPLINHINHMNAQPDVLGNLVPWQVRRLW
jgi:hypothetical protein